MDILPTAGKVSLPADKHIEVSNNILTELELSIEEADLRITPHQTRKSSCNCNIK